MVKKKKKKSEVADTEPARSMFLELADKGGRTRSADSGICKVIKA